MLQEINALPQYHFIENGTENEAIKKMTTKRYTNLDYYDSIAATYSSERKKNVNVFSDVNGMDELAICQVDTLFPFTFLKTPNENSFMYITAALLAMYHLNNGIGDVVPSLAGLDETCDLRLTGKFFDTEMKPGVAIEQLNNDCLGVGDSNNTSMRPCAVMGSNTDLATSQMSIISFSHDLFHSIFVPKENFDYKSRYPFITRIIPAQSSESFAVMQYLKSIGVSHVALIYTSQENYMLNQNFFSEASLYDIKTNSFPLQDKPPTDPVERQELISSLIARVKKTMFRYICVYFNKFYYEEIMTEAYRQGIAGPGYNWIFGSGLSAEEVVEMSKDYTPGSPLYIATQGTSFIKNLFVRKSESFPHYENFLNVWSNLDVEMVNYVNNKWPKYSSEELLNYTDFKAKPEYFKSTSKYFPPDSLTYQIYDTTVALGIAACSSVNNGTYFGAKEHFDAWTQIDNIEALSGSLKFLPTGSRDPSTSLYAITNVVEKSTAFEGYYSYFFELNSTSKTETWIKNPYKEHCYSDGSTIPPEPLPPLQVEKIHISPVVRGVSLGICFVCLLASIYCGMYVYRHKKDKIIKSSQPIFLFMICFGTFLMASSIIWLSIDDQIASVQFCNVCCMVSPWLFIVGFVISFSALFSKTRRINTIISQARKFRRVQIQAKDVLPPFFCLLGLDVLLLSIWTALAPLTWTREVTDVDVFGRIAQTTGYCTYTVDLIGNILVGLLLAINFGVLLYAIFQAYLARSIPTEFNESQYITMTMASMFQVNFIGIPLLIFLYDQPDAALLLKMCLISIICFAVLFFLFVPKMFPAKFGINRIYVETTAPSIVNASTIGYKSMKSAVGFKDSVYTRFSKTSNVK